MGRANIPYAMTEPNFANRKGRNTVEIFILGSYRGNFLDLGLGRYPLEWKTGENFLIKGQDNAPIMMRQGEQDVFSQSNPLDLLKGVCF